jgi:hypothetical protein
VDAAPPSRQTPQVRDRRHHGRNQLAIGLAASLLAHAGVIVWFLAREPVQPAPVPTAYQVELYDLPPLAQPPAEPPAREPVEEQARAPDSARPEASPPLTPTLSPRKRGERENAPRTGEPGRTPGTPENAPRTAEPGRTPGTPENAPRTAEPGTTPGMPGPGPGVGTEPGGAPPSADDVGEWFAKRGLGGGGAGAEAGDGKGDLSAPVPGDVKRAIQDGPPGSGNARERAERLSSELHASDVSRYPDRRWTGLRDSLGRGFKPSEESVGSGATDGPVGSFLRSYGGYASEYGKTGSPYGDAPDATGRSNSRIASASEAADGTSRNPGGFGTVEERSAAAAGFTPREVVVTGRTAVVAMEQDARGVVIGVWLVRSSGSSEYDGQAMRQVEKLRGQAVQAPWGAAITEWAFRTDVAITPFRPGLGGTFDLGFEGVEIERPLEPRLRTHPPELVAIRRVRDGKGGPG